MEIIFKFEVAKILEKQEIQFLDLNNTIVTVIMIKMIIIIIKKILSQDIHRTQEMV